VVSTTASRATALFVSISTADVGAGISAGGEQERRRRRRRRRRKQKNRVIAAEVASTPTVAPMKIPAFEPLEGWAWVSLVVAIEDENESEDDVEDDGLAADTAGTWARRMMSVRVPARSWRLWRRLRIRVITL
jgi:hypothetical protein